MSIRIAAIEVSHWHSLYDSAYLRHLARMPDVQFVGGTAILVLKNNVLRVITARGAETLPAEIQDNLSFLILRQTLEHWQRGASPPVSVHDCYRAVQLIDQAYAMAGQPYPGAAAL